MDNLSGQQREKLEDKIAKWEALISSTQAKVDDAMAELALINDALADISAALAVQQALCDGTPPPPPEESAGIFYLHADHLGRPQFATDSTGAIVWDMGGEVTPFGEGVNMAGAFAQKLMFPGQYTDAETGTDITLSHNWHRTYDPTLGRYLQSDPIGLAGGLNRYAYVGGNPMGYVDPDGQLFFIPILGAMAVGVVTDLLVQTQIQGKSLKCVNLTSTVVSAGLGVLPGASIIKPLNAYNSARKTQKGIRRIFPKFNSQQKRDSLNDAIQAADIGLISFSAGLEIPNYLPEYTIGNDCECKKPEIKNVQLRGMYR